MTKSHRRTPDERQAPRQHPGPVDPVAEPLRCPICLDIVSWSDDEPHEIWDGSGYTQVDLARVTDPVKRAALLRDSRRRCPNPSQDTLKHYLPSLYGAFRPPIVVGMVGERRAGKSHLLAAMIAEIERGGLQPYGLSASPVDFGRHAGFLREQVEALVNHGTKLQGTIEGVSDFADALLVRSSTGTWPVTFFDVSGEDLVVGVKQTRFLDGATALIFVVNPSAALGRQDDEDHPADPNNRTDKAFDTVLGKLSQGRQYIEVPAAVVVAKSDRLRFEHPIDRWLRRQPNGRVDAAAVRAESRDAYGFLYQHGATAWLKPFHECRRCTLHFVSATGAEVRENGFPRGVTPRRVLEPLIALLAMSGVFDGPDALEVGS